MASSEKNFKEQSINPDLPTDMEATKIDHMPVEIINPGAQASLDRLGPFVYEKYEVKEEHELPTDGPYEMANGAAYFGQWHDRMRQGRGKQIW